MIINLFLKSLIAFARGNRYLIIPKGYLGFFLFDRTTKNIRNIILRNKVDWYTVRQIFLTRENSLSEIAHSSLIEVYYKNLLKNGKTPLVLDCGSNIGLTALFYYDTYPRSKMLLAEIDLVNLTISQANIASSDFVEHLHAAISNSNEKFFIDDSHVQPNAFRVASPDASLSKKSVTGVTINKLIRENSQCAPFLCKIDIEGHELQLFESNTEWMQEFPIIIIELHDWLLVGEYSSRNLLNVLSKYPREVVILGEHLVLLHTKDLMRGNG